VAIPAPCQTQPKPAPAAHAAPAQKQTFEVASVRLEDPGGKDTNSPKFQGTPTVFPSNVLIIRHTMLQSLICEAYGVDFNRVVGGPDWLDREHYDLYAKIEGDARLTQVEMQPLMQNLLQERFHLKAHREQKIVPGYALVIAKGGPKLQPNKGAPSIWINSADSLKIRNDSVENLAGLISSLSLKQPVVDKTGIHGQYDFDLKFCNVTGPLSDDPRFSSLPNIFTALQEQLGLKLVPQKVPVDFLVIDHADRVPTEN
jgi:uncharacterized protein (TIGR03435 family)